MMLTTDEMRDIYIDYASQEDLRISISGLRFEMWLQSVEVAAMRAVRQALVDSGEDTKSALKAVDQQIERFAENERCEGRTECPGRMRAQWSGIECDVCGHTFCW